MKPSNRVIKAFTQIIKYNDYHLQMIFNCITLFPQSYLVQIFRSIYPINFKAEYTWQIFPSLRHVISMYKNRNNCPLTYSAYIFRVRIFRIFLQIKMARTSSYFFLSSLIKSPYLLLGMNLEKSFGLKEKNP